MATAQNERRLATKDQVWLAPIFFLAAYVYLWLFIRPRLIYDGFGAVVLDVPVFATGWRPLRDALSLPGGLVVYMYGLLSQGFYYSWLGALLAVLMALCLWGLARQHCIRAGYPHPAVLPYFPAIAVLLLYHHYDHPLAVCLTLFVGLSFSLVFERRPVRRVPLRGAVFCLLAGTSYWLGGAGAAFLFALLTAIYLLSHRAWLAALLALPAAGGIIWVLADYAFYLSSQQAFLTLTPFSRNGAEGLRPLSKFLLVMLYAFVPATVSFLGLWRTLAGKRGSRPHRGFQKRAWSSVPLAVLAIGLWGSYDGIHRRMVVMNTLARQERWPQVLEHAQRLPQNVYSIYCNHDINRALYETGRLPYDMFCFPQNPHALLLTHEEDESCMTQLKMCEAFLELGNVDLAEKLAAEFLVAKGPLGIVLEKLAWISLIKGQADTARVYLNALKRDLIYQGRADTMLRGLDQGFEPEDAARIRRINSYLRRKDGGRLNRESVEEMLTGLLERNPQNRMAFEYLMAGYLLAGQVDKIAANMRHLPGLGYGEVPTLYEEAMMMHFAAQRQPLDVDQLPVSRGTMERYERFVQLNDSLRTQNRAAGLLQLVREFGTSYFFYYRFTVSWPQRSEHH